MIGIDFPVDSQGFEDRLRVPLSSMQPGAEQGTAVCTPLLTSATALTT